MVNLCGLVSAESNRAALRIVAEDPACWAVTPTTGGTKTRELRLTASSITSKKGTKVSEEIRADRMVPSIIEVSASADGEINYELSAFTQDDLFAAFLLGTWSKSMLGSSFKGDAVSWTTSAILTIAGGDYTAYFVSGQRIKVAGFGEYTNNNYFTISSLAFSGGNTNITVSTSVSVVEAGNALSSVQDANDVILLSTAIRSGTSGASTFDSNGGNLFTTPISSGYLVNGQTIYVDGLGRATAAITFTGGLPADADTITLFDGVNTLVFEFDSNSAYTRGRIPVTIGATDDLTAVALSKAINLAYAAKQILCNSTYDLSGAGAVLAVKHCGVGTPTIAESATNVTVTAFSGQADSEHGFFQITGTAADVITVTPAPATNANAGTLTVLVKGSHVRNPGTLSSILKQSFTIETGFTDVGQYFVRKGMRVGGFKLSVKSGEIVTGSFSFMGKDTTLYTATVLGSSPYTALASTATEPLNATVNVGSVKKNGTAMAVSIASIEMDGSASLREQMAVGSKFPVGIAYGRMSVTGKMEAYFETTEMYSHFLNHDTISMSFTFTDTEGNSYVFAMPALKITSDPIAPGGIDQDVMESLDFVTQRDPVYNTQFMIDRFSSVFPTTVAGA